MCTAIKHFIDVHFDKTYFIYVLLLVFLCNYNNIKWNISFVWEIFFLSREKSLTDVSVTVNGYLKDNNCPNILFKSSTSKAMELIKFVWKIKHYNCHTWHLPYVFTLKFKKHKTKILVDEREIRNVSLLLTVNTFEIAQLGKSNIQT